MRKMFSGQVSNARSYFHENNNSNFKLCIPRFPLLCLEGKQARVCDTCHEIMTQLDLGQNDKMYEESLRYMQVRFF